MYHIFRDESGVVDAVNRKSDGKSVPWLEPKHPLTIELREWEKVNGKLNLEPLRREELFALQFPGGLEEAKQLAQNKLIALAELAQEKLTEGYSSTERDTWERKERESIEFLKTKLFTLSKYLEIEAMTICASTDRTKVVATATMLAQKVLEKSDILRQASVRISGNRAKYSNEIANLSTIEAVLDYVSTISF